MIRKREKEMSNDIDPYRTSLSLSNRLNEEKNKYKAQEVSNELHFFHISLVSL
jgi:hypothetical protein